MVFRTIKIEHLVSKSMLMLQRNCYHELKPINVLDIHCNEFYLNFDVEPYRNMVV